MNRTNIERIRNGISFFKAMKELDSITVKKYLPVFIGLVEQLLKDLDDETVKSITNIFTK